MSAQPDTQDVPLIVDLDGTLVQSDMAIESYARLLKHHFVSALMLPWWLWRGIAYAKAQVASRAAPDVSTLPFHAPFLEWLREQGGRRQIVLCTGAHHAHADAVADHLGVFDEVLASDEHTNLTAQRKCELLCERFGTGGFDYAGNARADLPVFAAARQALVVAPTVGLRAALPGVTNLAHQFHGNPVTPAVVMRQLRLHQWLKNVLLFVPLFAAQRFDLAALVDVSIAFVAYGCVASSIYILNDLMDLSADRLHPRKRSRPFAAGTLPVARAPWLIAGLGSVALALTAVLPPAFGLLLLLYCLVSLVYNLWAKDVAVIDTLVLAGLYTLRLLAGAAAIAVWPSFWLLAFSMFFFLSVAMAKRCAELLELELGEDERIPGRQYTRSDLHTIHTQGVASGYAAVVVLALYLQSDEVASSYSQPIAMWLICPLMLYWINKLWLNTQRREMHDDPVVWAFENRVSRLIGLGCGVLLWLAL